MKPTIVFDIGGVLIDWNPRYLYRKLFSDAEDMEYFLEEICSPAWNAQTDEGKSFQDAIDELLPSYPRHAKHIQAYFSRWEEMVAGEFPGAVQILEELKAGGYPLAALSNFSSETFPIIHARYEFLDWFDPLIISGRVGLVKPDPQIFNLLLCSLDRDPQDCVYIDDAQDNVRAAAEIGFQSFLYTSPEGLREALKGLGLLSS